MRFTATITLRWVDRGSYQSLMVGRVEMAQVSPGKSSAWFFTLRFARDGERPHYSAPSEGHAKILCEAHALAVLT